MGYLPWAGIHCKSNFRFYIGFAENPLAWVTDPRTSILSVPDGFIWAEIQTTRISLSLKLPGHFANNHLLQSLSTVCFRSLEQENFVHIHEGRTLEQQHWENGDSPWKSDLCLKVERVLSYSSNLDRDEGCTYSLLDSSNWLLQVSAFPSWEKKKNALKNSG